MRRPGLMPLRIIFNNTKKPFSFSEAPNHIYERGHFGAACIVLSTEPGTMGA